MKCRYKKDLREIMMITGLNKHCIYLQYKEVNIFTESL